MALNLARPRIVLVTRKTRYEVLLERHGTQDQARFYVATRQAAAAALAAPLARSKSRSSGMLLQAQAAPPPAQATREVEQQHQLFMEALGTVQRALPAEQRTARVDRDSLDRFVFEPTDIIVVVGQDGLVPNAAKYLRGQFTIGVNPDPAAFEGVLCPHKPAGLPELLEWTEQLQAGLLAAQEERVQRIDLRRFPAAHSGPFRLQQRVMAQALREDGQRLLALNEVFVGHRSHQSARYTLSTGGMQERQSSSGILICTGTGSSGWGRSMAQQLGLRQELPTPEEARLAWFVREPWESVSTGASLSRGWLGPEEALEAASEMGEGGVIFADGIEGDRLEFNDGQSVILSLAEEVLNLVVTADGSAAPPAQIQSQSQPQASTRQRSGKSG